MGGNIGVGGAGHGLDEGGGLGSREVGRAGAGLGETGLGDGGRVINLTAHGIGPRPGRALDPGEDGTWVDVGRFERVLDAVAERPDVRLTFDDGNASDVDTALPRLLARGLTAEFFVLAGRLGEPGRLTVDGVRELVKAGMRVGSHGWAHRDWRRLTAAQANEELVRAHRVLADITGEPVSRVAIPFGSYDRHVLRRLRRASVTRAYTSDGGPARPDAWLQARTSLRHDLDDAWVDRVLAPPGPAIRLRRNTARLIKRTRGR